MYRLLLLTASCLAASHPELRGEHPDRSDIDDGQCIPMKCDLGAPPKQCTELCALRQYLPICQPPGDFCLCQRLVGGTLEVISPDEVLDQPSDRDYGPLTIFTFIFPLGTFFQEEDHNALPQDHSLSFAQDTPEAFVVNVHEGRLFWLFRYVLSGLFFLMVALIVYELILCRSYDYEKFDVEEDGKWKTFNPVTERKTESSLYEPA